MQLDAIHAHLQKALGDRLPIEPLGVLRAAEAHRTFWRPANVRVILLAESHVFTSAAELARRVDLSPFRGSEVPVDFVRLVYCLGYGENSLLNQPIGGNAGTWQYWRLFWACLNDPRVGSQAFGEPVLKGHTSLESRVLNKLHLLAELRRQGIWLLDASLAALYGHPAKPSADLIRAAIDTSWPVHIGAVLAELQPCAIMVIGKMVYDILQPRLEGLAPGRVDWIYQPAAFKSQAAKQRDLRKLHDFCQRYASPVESCEVKPEEALILFLREVFRTSKQGWVLFGNGTIVLVPPGVLKPKEAAIAMLRKYGPIRPGTPQADFDVTPFADLGWLVTFPPASIVTFVPEGVMREHFGDAAQVPEVKVGLFGRQARALDASTLTVVHFEPPAGGRSK